MHMGSEDSRTWLENPAFPSKKTKQVPIVGQQPFCGHNAGVRYCFGFLALARKKGRAAPGAWAVGDNDL